MGIAVDSKQPITAVVQRRIKIGSEASFEDLMTEFMAFAMRQPGNLGITVIRPPQGSQEYTVLDRFATEDDRRRFKASDEYTVWMERLRSVSEADPEIEEMGGLAFWFTLPGNTDRRVPPRLKMAAVTLLGVYPLSILYPMVVVPLTGAWPAWLRSLVIACLIVGSLTWFVMPSLTRLLHRWLFPENQSA